ncbi:hypothetical protein HanRHA438_Chr17g0840341 [Helianthus annuus]|nr:hypothetical protein HanRHA438_Chr17g0840341 [Helianthus annuus]
MICGLADSTSFLRRLGFRLQTTSPKVMSPADFASGFLARLMITFPRPRSFPVVVVPSMSFLRPS